MKKKKNEVKDLKDSLAQAQKIGKLTFNGRNWVITILNSKGEITNYTFTQDQYWEVNQIIQTYINQRR
ncbi:hypothetical protein JEZ13_00915 [bacterium]|nr:hypothetical protein [bacterium]